MFFNKILSSRRKSNYQKIKLTGDQQITTIIFDKSDAIQSDLNTFILQTDTYMDDVMSIELTEVNITFPQNYPNLSYFLINFLELPGQLTGANYNNIFDDQFAIIPIWGYDLYSTHPTLHWSKMYYNSPQVFRTTFDQPSIWPNSLTVVFSRYDGSGYFTGTEPWPTDWSLTIEVLRSSSGTPIKITDANADSSETETPDSPPQPSSTFNENTWVSNRIVEKPCNSWFFHS